LIIKLHDIHKNDIYHLQTALTSYAFIKIIYIYHLQTSLTDSYDSHKNNWYTIYIIFKLHWLIPMNFI
jgi:hypothetical protein